ncbi:hypothetical protein E4U42_001719 [Claviceps africana]|uniref:Smr domain-containing protein n=1 Tax=Claviceps africana TaxID=83212 RepID=A0A8K0NJZ5_9HYPO|nr:hypothetical protein E4U42_001719 [Claviceps africana]
MTIEKNSELLRGLVDSFHTFLDEALIVAIAGDFDLTDPSAYVEARSTLQQLAHNVPSEEASGFNPSGIPLAADGADGREEQDDEAEENRRSACLEHLDTSTTSGSHNTSQAGTTDQSSTDASSHGPDSPDPNQHGTRLTSLDKESDEDKILVLQAMFADLKPYDVSYALKKAEGDFQLALDDLLNVQYLQSTGQQLKGVDGFFVADSTADSAKRKRRRRKKKQCPKATSSDPDLSSDGDPGGRVSAVAAAENGQDEVQYIAERFGIRSDQVVPIYHKCGGSQGAAVVELLKQYISHGIQTQEQGGQKTAETLASKYSHVPPEFMPTIVHVTGSIPQFAEDIAALLNKHFSKPPKAKKIDLAYRLTPLPQAEIEGAELFSSATTKFSRLGLASKPAPSDVRSVAEAMGRADTFHAASRDAAASAAQLHRRGASSSLYRQAAGYYAERAREQARYAQGASSTAADLLVDQQSTRDSIDLHGVLVRDGVRIARQRVQDWWQGLGELRASKAREQGGFTVITGLGRHSAGGVSQLRQSVAAALLQDGWKLNVETGKFVVTGRRR